MSPFIRLHFWTRRAVWRAGAVARLLFRLALIGVGMFLAIEIGQFLVTAVIALVALVVLVLVLGAFSADWRYAGVRVGQQYRRLTRRWRMPGKDSHR